MSPSHQNEEPMERHNLILAFTRVHVLDLCLKKAPCFRSMFPSSTSTSFMQLGYFTKFHPSCSVFRFASILFQISKALTGTDKKDLIRKLPKFIYDEEKASEVCLMIMVLKFKYRLQHTILSLYHATNWFYQKRRKALAEKIAQLNAAIDDVSSQLIPNDEPNGAAVASDEFEAAI
ncbi:hypothetical protein B296_00031863 [Ensete ventricosum]|uniref:Uncharacterized protein n=1 Tax=Ensete ventricosum TaxID=4639 RepID=A0A426XLT0_ENSVE|nr:hypothetical protein B296_00031863 [Ensete ventricosum]